MLPTTPILYNYTPTQDVRIIMNQKTNTKKSNLQHRTPPISAMSSAISIPIFGNTGITYEDIYAAAGVAAVSAFVIGGGIIVPRGLTTQQTFMAVGITVGSFLIMKQVIANMSARA
jgi:hypothetical protein